MLNVTLEAVIFIKNKNIIDLNKAAIELLGFSSKEELLNIPYDDFIASEDIKNIKSNIENRVIGKYEATFVNKKGKRTPVILEVSQFDENEIDTIIINILDLTDIKRREHILSQNVKMAQMGEMIGNIAHQWRQPLSVITTAASGIKMKKEYAQITDEELYALLDSIILNSEQLSDTIDMFRNFVEEKIELKQVILQDRINNALSIIETRLQNEHISLINNIDYSKPIHAVITLGELSQVIINIINNAIDVLLKNKQIEKSITIDLLEKAENVVITIEDNGGGISKETMAHIFEPYFTTKYKSVGTGIGLYMSYDIIVNHMKGNLYAKNTDKGAKFFIELPSEQRMAERRVYQTEGLENERRVKDRRLN